MSLQVDAVLDNRRHFFQMFMRHLIFHCSSANTHDQNTACVLSVIFHVKYNTLFFRYESPPDRIFQILPRHRQNTLHLFLLCKTAVIPVQAVDDTILFPHGLHFFSCIKQRIDHIIAVKTCNDQIFDHKLFLHLHQHHIQYDRYITVPVKQVQRQRRKTQALQAVKGIHLCKRKRRKLLFFPVQFPVIYDHCLTVFGCTQCDLYLIDRIFQRQDMVCLQHTTLKPQLQMIFIRKSGKLLLHRT